MLKLTSLALAALALLPAGCAAQESSRQSQEVASKTTVVASGGPTSVASQPRAGDVSERDTFVQRISSMTDRELWEFGSQRREAMSETLRLTGKLELPKWDDLYTAEATKREKALMLPSEVLAALSKPELEARILATEDIPFVARLLQQLERAHGSSRASLKYAKETARKTAELEAARPAQKQAELEAAQKRARPFVEGTAALEKYRTSKGCESPHAKEVRARIAELEESVSTFHAGRSFPQYEQEARDRHTALSFAFADEALRRGCLDDADRVYRSLVAFYTGGAYAGIRDRAKLGIDDVRAARPVRQ